jgi:hypothetical protein
MCRSDVREFIGAVIDKKALVDQVAHGLGDWLKTRAVICGCPIRFVCPGGHEVDSAGAGIVEAIVSVRVPHAEVICGLFHGNGLGTSCDPAAR